MKIYRAIALLILPVLVSTPTSFANAASVSSEEIQIVNETDDIDIATDNYSQEQSIRIAVPDPSAPSLYSVSETKYKTTDVYSKATGKVIGTVTLEYKTQQISGRPTFVLADCYATMQLNGSYRGNITITLSTIDVIVLQVDYNNLLDSGYTTVQFTP